MTNRQSGTFFTADGNLVLLDQFTNVLETDGGLVQFDAVMLGERVNKVGSSDGFGDAILPAAALDQIVEQECDDVIGLKKRAILVDDAKAVGITVGCNSDVSFGLAQLLA